MPLGLVVLQQRPAPLKCNFDVTFGLGDCFHVPVESVLAKMLRPQPHRFHFIMVCVEEALANTELEKALGLTIWIVIPWTLSAMLRCVKHLVLCESWAPENGEQGIGKP